MGAERAHLWVVGPHRIQNELLACHLSAETGIGCTLAGSLAGIGESLNQNPAEKKLVLKDCPPLPPVSVRQRILLIPQSPSHIVALFNVPTAKGVEKEVFPCGVRGFFYKGDTAGVFLKGIWALLGGELWVSRKILEECLLAGWNQGAHHGSAEGLTPRERQILAGVAAGLPNEDIAEDFRISPHTVKTHLYRIFKKIGVSNRFHAALWAARNL